MNNYRKSFQRANGANKTPTSHKCDSIESVEQIMNQSEHTTLPSAQPMSWNKIDKTHKFNMLVEYAQTYCTEKDLDETKYESMIAFFKDCLDKKKLCKVKDVCYDKENQIVTNIPGLMFNTGRNSFTIRNTDKHVATSRNLGPKIRNIRTIRNINE